jgi:hypothetical protein
MFQELLQAAVTREAADYRGRSSLSSQRNSRIQVPTGEVARSINSQGDSQAPYKSHLQESWKGIE